MSFDGQSVCGVPNNLDDRECKWPFLDVAVYAEGYVGQIRIADGIEEAIKAWNAVCGIRLTMSTNPKTAHIISRPGHIDGPGRVLAESGLPCGFRANAWRQLGQTYDSGDVWTLSDNPPQGKIDFLRVARHELGHAIGSGHIDAGNLMAPTYSDLIAFPQRGDIAQMTMRYGLPAPTEPSPPVTPPVPAPSPGDGGSVWDRVLPCLLTYGVDIFMLLTPEERKSLLETGLSLWRSLRPEEKQILEQLVKRP